MGRGREGDRASCYGCDEFVRSEDLEITMEDNFGEIHPEGQKTDMAPPSVAREITGLEVAVVEEVSSDRGQEEGPSVEHPSTPVATGPPPIPNLSLARRTSSSSSLHYAKLLPAKASRSSGEPLALGKLNCRNHPFFVGLFPLQATWCLLR